MSLCYVIIIFLLFSVDSKIVYNEIFFTLYFNKKGIFCVFCVLVVVFCCVRVPCCFYMFTVVQ